MNSEKPKHYALISRILSGIAYQPIREIRVERSGTLSVSFVCYVDASDMGLLCGQKGVVIKSIQQIFKFIAKKENLKHLGVFLRVHGGSTKRVKGRKAGWDPEEATNLAYEIIEATGHHIAHTRFEETEDCLGLIVEPKIPEPLFTAIHTVLDHLGKSYGKIFGLANNQ